MQYPSHVDEIVAFHHAHGGMSRFDKFRHIYKEILNKPLSKDRFEDLCRGFSELVYDRVLQCDFVPGALEFLKKYYKRLHLFIISSTPHEEINKIVDAKGLRAYFEEVFGSPTSKSYWTKHLIEQRKFDVDKVLFVGDALSDYRAAENNDIRFVARIVDGNEVFKDTKLAWKVKNLFELDTLISEGRLE